MLVGSGVLGFDGQCQSFNCPQVKPRHILKVLLGVLQAVQIETVRTVNEIDDGEENQRRVPGFQFAEHDD